ncbi:MAG: Na(+)-translocating NADH-quinone reductase subunit A [Saprospiraceae bacterium]|nr:Na(+)-translocating NADH-quinone reductase subunit A [Saprospiraceae bacterium]
MGKTIRLKKGYNIKIEGAASNTSITDYVSPTYAIKPTDFFGIAPIPKLIPNIGDEVKAGDPLFYDKTNPSWVYSSPVSGEVVEQKRGPKRRVEEVVIMADSNQQYRDFGRLDASASKAEVEQRLLESGCWQFIRQRPFNVTANPADTPKAVFISGFDTSPMAPDYAVVMKGREADFQAGVNALSKFASVHVSTPTGASIPAYQNLSGAEVHSFSGPHPAGNVGVQIHHIDPIKKGEVVWTVNPQDVLIIGKLMNEGIFDATRIITVGGPTAINPGYFRVKQGVNVKDLIGDAEHSRVISGDVLSGTKINNDGFLGFYDTQLSVVEEGDSYEMFGWLLPSYPRPTRSRSLIGSFLRNKPFKVNTNTHGEHRAFVVSGQYEDVLPMDVYPVHLIKAILANDFDGMEGLGIYEVVEEDLALCEFVCTSKQSVQATLRDGLDYMREQA